MRHTSHTAKRSASNDMFVINANVRKRVYGIPDGCLSGKKQFTVKIEKFTRRNCVLGKANLNQTFIVCEREVRESS